MCQQPRVYHFSKTCTFYGDFGTYFLFRFDLYQSFQGTHHPPQYTPLLNNSVISTTKVNILTFRSAYQNKLFQANTKLITQTSSFRRFKPNKLWLHRDTSFNAKPIKMLSFPSVAEAYRPDPPSPAGVNFFLIIEQTVGLREREREDSDVDFEASRRSTRVQSKSTIRSALFLAKH